MTAEAARPYGELVASRGLGGSHRRILAQVPAGSRVLDVGCATGYLAALLSERGCTVVGMERDPAAAAQAEPRCAEVIVGDFERSADRDALPGPFDVVLFGDVLEHLVDPWEALAATPQLLAPEGVVVASIPNVAAWPVRLGLAAGRFDYADFGLLDRTHLRFFTRASAHDLVRRAGFEIVDEQFAHVERPPGPLRRTLPLPMSLVDRALARVLPGLFAQQFVLRLRPSQTRGEAGRR